MFAENAPMSDVVFILGAGFNADASATVPHVGKLAYPLVGDLLRDCFDLASPPAGKSVEALFQEALEKGEHEPIRRLACILQQADYYLSEHACNSYRVFLDAFPSAPILTFNYDGLLEILALRMGQWRPEDGFGVNVEVCLPPQGKSQVELPVRSTRQILHLHGSLYLYAQECEIVPRGLGSMGLLRLRDEPRFVFDPDSVTNGFHPFAHPAPGPLYSYPHERVIAPIPSKAEGRRGAFFRRVHQRAVTVLAQASRVIVIGYSFSPHDLESYGVLLRTLAGVTVVIVAPEAVSLGGRLAPAWSSVDWLPIPRTFAQWVDSSFPGVSWR